MKTILLLPVIATMIFFFPKNSIAQCGMMNMNHEKQEMKTTGQDTTVSKDSTKVIYTCSMHPEIISDKPGYCPKCGMKLVKKTSNEKPKEEMKMKKMGMMGMGIAIMAVMMVVMIVVVGSR